MAYDFSKLKANITETEEWLMRELSGVRTGRATPTLLDGIKGLLAERDGVRDTGTHQGTGREDRP